VDDTTPQLGGMLDVNGNALGDGTLELLTFTETVSAVNHVNITNAATAGAPVIAATGDDAAVALDIDTKGAGSLNLKTGGTNRLVLSSAGVALAGNLAASAYYVQWNDGYGIRDDSGNEHLIFQKTTSAVTYFEMTNAATGNGPILGVAGETNVDLNIQPAGTGEVIIADCEFSGGVAYQSATLTSGAGTKTMDGNTAADYTYEQSGASPTFAAPTNVVVGQRFSLEITDTTGSGTITWNAAFEWEGGTAPANLSAGETRQIDFRVAAVSGTTATRVSGFYSGVLS